jgi:Bacterial PH domain
MNDSADLDLLAEFGGITRFALSGSARLARSALRDDEDLRVVASGSDERFTGGVLCLTDKRLLFVRERVFARPIIISVALSDIENVVIEERPLSAVLTVTAGAKEFTFDVTPKLRTWNLFWPIRKCVDDRKSNSLGEHPERWPS